MLVHDSGSNSNDASFNCNFSMLLLNHYNFCYLLEQSAIYHWIHFLITLHVFDVGPLANVMVSPTLESSQYFEQLAII